MIKFVKLVEVYPAGVTTKTFTHEIINDDSVIEVYTEDANIYPIATTQSGNTVTISIVDHDEPVEVCVTVNNMVSYSEPITSSDVFDPIFGSVSSALLHYEEVKQNNLIAGSGITIGGSTGSEISADVSAEDLATVSGEVSAIKESLTQYEQSGFLSINLLNAELLSTPTSPLTCVKNADGTFTLNGTPTSNNFIKVYNASFPKGTYKLSGCPSGGNATSKYALRAYYYETSTATTFDDIGDGVVMTFNRDVTLNIEIIARSGQNCNGLVFKPMITKLLDKGYSDYQKYAPSNTELKQSLAQLVADSTPQNLSLTTENNVKQTYRLRAKKIGKEIVLNIYGALNAITSDLTSWKPLFQMPQGMGTSDHIDFALCLGGAPYMVQAMVTNTGTIQFVPKQALNEGTLFFINLVYVLD